MAEDVGRLGAFTSTCGSRREWGFSDVRRAALAFAREVERRAPADATTTWWRKDREADKVFVDYNQNARDHTIASAYSVRGVPRRRSRPPSRWDEIDDVEPQDFTIATVPERFAQLGDLHQGIDEAVFALGRAAGMGGSGRARGRRGPGTAVWRLSGSRSADPLPDTMKWWSRNSDDERARIISA